MSKGIRSVLIVCPTGSGKTVIMSEIVKSATSKGRKVLMLAHRTELLFQMEGALRSFGVDSGMVAAGHPFDASKSVQIGSVLTVINRKEKLKNIGLILIDEAQHYKKGSTYDRILDHFNVHTIGVTATPCRLSGEPLGDFFEELVLGPTVADLIKAGHLCDYEIYEPSAGSIKFDGVKKIGGDFSKQILSEMMDKPTITGSAITEYKKHCDGKQAVVFCVDVAHAKGVAKEFYDSGVPAMSIDGKIDPGTRSRIIDAFKRGEIKVLTNCNIVTEGFDLPALEAVIQLRPTASLSLYLQMVGRGLRTFEGKDRAIILDHVGNHSRHGLPCDDRDWSLTGKIKAKKKGFSTKNCEKCFAISPSNASKCFNCGFVWTVKAVSTGPEEVEGELSKLDKEAFKKKQRQKRAYEEFQAKSIDELTELGRSRGYQNPRFWAKKKFDSRQAKKIRGR